MIWTSAPVSYRAKVTTAQVSQYQLMSEDRIKEPKKEYFLVSTEYGHRNYQGEKRLYKGNELDTIWSRHPVICFINITKSYN